MREGENKEEVQTCLTTKPPKPCDKYPTQRKRMTFIIIINEKRYKYNRTIIRLVDYFLYNKLLTINKTITINKNRKYILII